MIWPFNPQKVQLFSIKFRRHLLMSLCGLMIFHFLTFAYPFWPKITQMYTDADLHNSTIDMEPVGCNESRLPWCSEHTPPNVWLYFISFSVFIGKVETSNRSLINLQGFAFQIWIWQTQTIFSHILGPRRQAVLFWVDLMQKEFRPNKALCRWVGVLHV